MWLVKKTYHPMENNQMFLLLKKYKKGVSPVIAIVLLIALTVAAAAVIWTLTSGILDSATGDSLNVKSASGSISPDKSTLTITYTFTASSAMTISGASMVSHANATASTSTPSSTIDPSSLNAGDTSVTVKFTGAASDFIAGTYEININWVVVGGSNTITASTVNAS